MTDMPIPTIGRIVHYHLAQYDAEQINRRREDARQRALAVSGPDLMTGMVVHSGNHVNEGDVFPAMITRVWSANPEPGAAVNLQVFLDGNDTYWATSRCAAEEPTPCRFTWPART